MQMAKSRTATINLDDDDGPVMPRDFWPDEVIVIGKYDGLELAFAVLREEAVAYMPDSMHALKLALWHAANSSSGIKATVN